MGRVTVLAVGVLLASAVLAGAAWAQTTRPNMPGTQGTQYPSVSSVQAFSAESDHLSIPGYLRYLTYQQTGQWLTLDEAKRVVFQQQGQ